MINIIADMTDEIKISNAVDSASVRSVMKQLDEKIQFEAGKKIDRKIRAMFEKLNQENMRIWETCVDYAQKLKADKIGKY